MNSFMLRFIFGFIFVLVYFSNSNCMRYICKIGYKKLREIRHDKGLLIGRVERLKEEMSLKLQKLNSYMMQMRNMAHMRDEKMNEFSEQFSGFIQEIEQLQRRIASIAETENLMIIETTFVNVSREFHGMSEFVTDVESRFDMGIQNI